MIEGVEPAQGGAMLVEIGRPAFEHEGHSLARPRAPVAHPVDLRQVAGKLAHEETEVVIGIEVGLAHVAGRPAACRTAGATGEFTAGMAQDLADGRAGRQIRYALAAGATIRAVSSFEITSKNSNGTPFSGRGTVL